VDELGEFGAREDADFGRLGGRPFLRFGLPENGVDLNAQLVEQGAGRAGRRGYAPPQGDSSSLSGNCLNATSSAALQQDFWSRQFGDPSLFHPVRAKRRIISLFTRPRPQGRTTGVQISALTGSTSIGLTHQLARESTRRATWAARSPLRYRVKIAAKLFCFGLAVGKVGMLDFT
jgi:hypothetical protein